jgi:chaperonin cofactor prefoldin
MDAQNDFLDSLPETNELLDNTIDTLTNGVDLQSGKTDTNLLQQWIGILNQTENTQALGSQLSELSDVLMQESPDTAQIQRLLNEIADATEEFSTEVGPEGELPAQLEGLAAALRNLGIQLS